MWLGINKRKFPRANYRCLITLGRKGSPKHFLTHTENIGVGGISVALDEGLAVFTEVSLELILKDNNLPVKCKGNIVWVVRRQTIQGGVPVIKFDTGIEFVNIKDTETQRIEKVVEGIIKKVDKNKQGR